MTAVLEAEHVTKRFGSLTALSDMSLTVNQGEVFGYLGPNGAGKTTTIRLVLDFLRPTSGTLKVLGAPSRTVETRSRIGYLPADLHLDPSYTGNDVIDFFGRLVGGVERPYVDGLLNRFDLDPTRPIRELSTGNRRKVGIVQAFMHRPELLVLDEPTSGLDPLLQQQFHELLRECASEGATVFLSSHVLSEVETLADRVGVLRSGKLVAVAPVSELRAQARQRIDLLFASPVPVSSFLSLPGVSSATSDSGWVRLQVDGPVDPVVKEAARHDALRIVAPEVHLEDIFLGFYEDPPIAGGGER